MKRVHWIVLAAVVSLTGCQHFVKSDVVVPAASEVAAIDVFSGSPRPSSLNLRKIESLVSFLRDDCHWTRAKAGDSFGRNYTIVIHRVDSREEIIEAGQRDLVVDGYRCHLSARAAERLGELCDLEVILLQPFYMKKT